MVICGGGGGGGVVPLRTLASAGAEFILTRKPEKEGGRATVWAGGTGELAADGSPERSSSELESIFMKPFRPKFMDRM
jgi:hypothetical protein